MPDRKKRQQIRATNDFSVASMKSGTPKVQAVRTSPQHTDRAMTKDIATGVLSIAKNNTAINSNRAIITATQTIKSVSRLKGKAA